MEEVMKLLMALLPIITGIAAECTYDVTPQIATIGEKMVITCNLMMCFEDSFMWFRVNGTNRIPIDNEGSKKLVVSINVTSAAEVGGQEYECYCSGDLDNCKKYNITVKPKVSLLFIPEVVKSGSSVSVICRAESFPPANSENYQMKHPRNKNITHELLPDGGGVVHKIQAADKGEDKGVYDCIVTVPLSHYTDSIQSEVYANLTVYDPPTIIGVRNFTLMNLNPPLAVLECVINNTELDVWVNWTMSDGKQIEVEHITSHNDNTFYLVLYKAMPGNYMCLLFSTYSPKQPEDTVNASVINGSGSSFDCGDNNMVKSAKVAENAIIAVLSTVNFLQLIAITTLIFVFIKKKYGIYSVLHKLLSVQQTVGRNDDAELDESADTASDPKPNSPGSSPNSKCSAKNQLFEECNENGENQMRDKSVEGTSTSLTGEDTISTMETSRNIHTEPASGDEDDVSDSPTTSGLPDTQGKSPLPLNRSNRPCSASKRGDVLEPLKESVTEYLNTTLPSGAATQNVRPGSASKSSRKQRRLSRTISSASLDPMEAKGLLAEDADGEAANSNV